MGHKSKPMQPIVPHFRSLIFYICCFLPFLSNGQDILILSQNFQTDAGGWTHQAYTSVGVTTTVPSGGWITGVNWAAQGGTAGSYRHNAPGAAGTWWMFSPGVVLTAGKQYYVKYGATLSGNNSSNLNRTQVRVGTTGPNTSGTPILASTNIITAGGAGGYVEFTTGNFDCTTTGTYYFKIADFFTATGFACYFDGIRIYEVFTAPPATPACFRSVSSGAWNSPSTWESRDNCTGSWVPATMAPQANSLGVEIQSGHNVSISTAVVCSLITVQAGGTLTVASGGGLTVSNGAGADLTVNGELTSTGGNVITAGGAEIVINNVYRHIANGGSLPSATWADGSNCFISGMTTTTPTNLAQNFFNLTWDSPAQTGNAVLTGTSNPVNVRGSFEYRPSGGGLLDLSNINRVWTGQFYIGGVVALMRGTASGTATLRVGSLTINDQYSTTARLLINNSTSTASITASLFVTGDVLINPVGNLSPAISFNTFGSTNIPIALLDVEGNFTLTNGSLTGAPNVAPNNTQNLLRFNGNGTKVFSKTSSSMNNVNVSVFSPATLDMGNAILDNVGNFTLTAGATLRIGSAQGISLSGNSGNIQNSGGTRTFSAGSNYTYYNAYGSGIQETGNGLPATVNNLSIENTSGTTLSSASVTINGVFNNSGLFILEDTKALIQSTTSTLSGSGTVRVIRQGDLGNQTYNFWSAPVSPVSLNVLGSANRYYYDPALGTPSLGDDEFDPGWQPATGVMALGRGYTATGAGNVTFNGIPGNAPNGSPIEVDVVLPASNTGFNLIGNPFPSAINAASFLNDNAGIIDGTVWLWDQAGAPPFVSSDFATINALGATSGGGSQVPVGYISSGQGFFVNRSVPGTDQVEFRNSQRTTAGNAQFFSDENILRHRLTLSNSAMHINELLVGFKSDASAGFDHAYDARKRVGNPNLAFYSLLDGEPYAIQGLELNQQHQVVELGFISTSSGTHHIELKASEGHATTQMVILEDRQLGLFKLLHPGEAYTFEATAGAVNDRFYLHTLPDFQLDATASGCTGNAGKISLSQPEWHGFQYNLISENGNQLPAGTLDGNTMRWEQLNAGTYTVEIQHAALEYYRMLNVWVEDQTAANLQITSTNGTQVFAGQVLEFESNLPAATGLIWNPGDGTQASGIATLSHTFEKPGIYAVSLTGMHEGCAVSASLEITVNADAALSTGVMSGGVQAVIWPQPANELIQIRFSGNQEAIDQLRLMDASGRVVFTETNLSSNETFSIPSGFLPAGMYLLELQTASMRSLGKVMIAR